MCASMKILQLKNQYLETLEGEETLVGIINEKIEFEEVLTYEEGSYWITDLVTEAANTDLFAQKEFKELAYLRELLQGKEAFEYPFSRWEVEMKMMNPSREQVEQYLSKNWYYPIDINDKEELNDIMEGQSYAFHDCVSLTCLKFEQVKALQENIDWENLLEKAKPIEAELNKMGIFFEQEEDADDKKEDVEFLTALKNMMDKAIEENSGLLFVEEF